jgi:hypothetical protein
MKPKSFENIDRLDPDTLALVAFPRVARDVSA